MNFSAELGEFTPKIRKTTQNPATCSFYFCQGLKKGEHFTGHDWFTLAVSLRDRPLWNMEAWTMRAWWRDPLILRTQVGDGLGKCLENGRPPGSVLMCTDGKQTLGVNEAEALDGTTFVKVPQGLLL